MQADRFSKNSSRTTRLFLADTESARVARCLPFHNLVPRHLALLPLLAPSEYRQRPSKGVTFVSKRLDTSPDSLALIKKLHAASWSCFRKLRFPLLGPIISGHPQRPVLPIKRPVTYLF